MEGKSTACISCDGKLGDTAEGIMNKQERNSNINESGVEQGS